MRVNDFRPHRYDGKLGENEKEKVQEGNFT